MNHEMLIKEVGKHLGIEDLQPDREGKFYFIFDDAIEVSISKGWTRNTIRIESDIADLPEENKKDIYFNMLKHSPVIFRDSDAVIAIDKDRNKIQIFLIIDINTKSVQDIVTQLEKFVNSVETMIKRFDSWIEQSSLGQSFSMNDMGLNIIRP